MHQCANSYLTRQVGKASIRRARCRAPTTTTNHHHHHHPLTKKWQSVLPLSALHRIRAFSSQSNQIANQSNPNHHTNPNDSIVHGSGAVELDSSQGKRLHILVYGDDDNSSLIQRATLHLSNLGHTVSFEIATSPGQMEFALQRYASSPPDLIVCPAMQCPIPNNIRLSMRPCFMLNPGLLRPNDLDAIGQVEIENAILSETNQFQATVTSFNPQTDETLLWCSNSYTIDRPSDDSVWTKYSVYKHEAVQAALDSLTEAVTKFSHGHQPPTRKPYPNKPFKAQKNLLSRNLDWTSAHKTVRTVRLSDSIPGARACFAGQRFLCFGAQFQPDLVSLVSDRTLRKAKPGDIVGTRDEAILVKCDDGCGVWISHLEPLQHSKDVVGDHDDHDDDFDEHNSFAMPATMALPRKFVKKLPGAGPTPPLFYAWGDRPSGWQEIWATEHAQVVYLHFDFFRGSSRTSQCQRLRRAINEADMHSKAKVMVLLGGYDHFGTGLSLNEVEASDDTAESALDNIVAINQWIERFMRVTDKLTVSALRGMAAAGSLMGALAGDEVWAHRNVLLHPYFKSFNYSGSGYWTHNLVQRCGAETALMLTESLHPADAFVAKESGMVDRIMGDTPENMWPMIVAEAERLAKDPKTAGRIAAKQQERRGDQAAAFWQNVNEKVAHEVSLCKENFSDPLFDDSRRRYVFKQPKVSTPHYLLNTDQAHAMVISGTSTAAEVRRRIRNEISRIKQAQRDVDPVAFSGGGGGVEGDLKVPGLTMLLVRSSHSAPSELYVKLKSKACEEVGIVADTKYWDATDKDLEAQILAEIRKRNQDPRCHAIVVQRPLPESVDEHTIFEAIDARKDVDGLASCHIGRLAMDFEKRRFFIPCTARAVIHLILRYDVKLLGKQAVVIGQSNTVGIPVQMYLSSRGATVTTCQLHTLPENLKQVVRNADVVIAAAGVPNLVKGSWIKQGAVVIDVGVNVSTKPRHKGDRKVVGDVEFDEARRRAAYITPVPGGVGPVTVSMLLQNTLDAFHRIEKERIPLPKRDITFI